MAHIVWFRQDLRLQDNPALYHACKMGDILPIYIHDTYNPNDTESMGGASKVWLHHALQALNKSLHGSLSVFAGNPQQILSDLTNKYSVQSIHWNRCYEPWQIQRDTYLKSILPVQVASYNGTLLWEPWQITKADGTPYLVFTPFYKRGCLNASPPTMPLPVPKNISIFPHKEHTHIEDLRLLPTHPAWHTNTIMQYWKMGETQAHKAFKIFLQSALPVYKQGRDIPSVTQTSRLAPHIHFGEISVRYLWHMVSQQPESEHKDTFLSELGWREFAYNQLYYHPDLPIKNIKPKFDHFPWGANTEYIQAWQQGRTGIPMVDAGMRQLWQTGYMHNRVRMIAGSFLVKNLMTHWHHGERWFWDCLCDADMASNSASWQWVAGCGLDASPFFRIFNPITQGQKFDPDGTYIRTFIPELSALSNDYVHAPYTTPPMVLHSAGITLGKTYPYPIVDIKQSRLQALNGLNRIKNI